MTVVTWGTPWPDEAGAQEAIQILFAPVGSKLWPSLSVSMTDAAIP